MARTPVVAGTFYEANAQRLEQEIEDCFLSRLGPGDLPQVQTPGTGRLLGLVCPHAGYIYSGPAAAHSFHALAADGLPDVVVMIGPNHYGLGGPISLSLEPEWDTPLGTVHTDLETAQRILDNTDIASADELAHRREHSLEVQIPFLQYLMRHGGEEAATRVVAISIAHLSYEDSLIAAEEVGRAIAQALGGQRGIVLASTDLTHYESKATARTKDSMVIDRIVALDAPGLLEVVQSQSVTMCGPIGTAIMIEACKAMGATSARKLAYYSSGDITGDSDQVVGYAAVAVER